jgi:Outer membrane protein beta-barrel domain
MNTNCSLVGIACRAAAFSFLVAGSASLLQAQQSPSVPSTAKAPLFLASESAPFGPSGIDLSASSSSSSSSSSDSPVASDGHFLFNSATAALDSSQPPPRRYGRPNYSDSHSNPDGSNKYFFLGGIGLTLPVGNTHIYETPSWGFQFGGGRNFNKNIGVGLQFDYDHFGLQGATLTNQTTLYDTGCPAGTVAAGLCGLASPVDGNNHVWSFTLNPTYTFNTEGSLGAYVVVGGGFYHKVTNFTEPTVEEECYYFCEDVQVNANIDHYTSNAGGVNGGFGLTYKFSHFSNERFYMEARYVLMLNSQRYGVTAQDSPTTIEAYTGSNYYPQNSNRTTYIPIKFGLRF